ncbi:hypothetical protein Aab01nite_79680 [Paractinoplanes abujensis]|nr:hypothetical protein Aab01nite_79680 [Actinoplanes abujensis]
MTAGFARMYGELDPALAGELDERRRMRQDVPVDVWAPLLDLNAAEPTVFAAIAGPVR